MRKVLKSSSDGYSARYEPSWMVLNRRKETLKKLPARLKQGTKMLWP